MCLKFHTNNHTNTSHRTEKTSWAVSYTHLARKKVIQDCGMVMGGSIHSTLPDEEINWAFSTHPEVITRRITVHEEQTE